MSAQTRLRTVHWAEGSADMVTIFEPQVQVLVLPRPIDPEIAAYRVAQGDPVAGQRRSRRHPPLTDAAVRGRSPLSSDPGRLVVTRRHGPQTRLP
jgi:hypothetical protein